MRRSRKDIYIYLGTYLGWYGGHFFRLGYGGKGRREGWGFGFGWERFVGVVKGFRDGNPPSFSRSKGQVVRYIRFLCC